jgi:hypothetical protein
VAVQHYIYGNTLGQIEKQTGIGYSSLVDAMHQLARRLKDVSKPLIQVYRQAAVKSAIGGTRQVGVQMAKMATRGCFAPLT